MERSKSVGIIAYKNINKSVSFLLLHHGGEYWNFPKGRKESGEGDLQTAKRELLEETGITNIQIIPDFEFSYDYDFDSVIENGIREKVYKTVKFFLGQVKEAEVVISDEHLDFGWFDYETALTRLHFQNSQNALKKAYQYILSHNGFML